MKKNQATIIIDSDAVNEIIIKKGLDKVMDDLTSSLEESLLEYNSENIQIPTRSGFNYKKPFLGLVEWMPLMKKGEEVVIKVVGYHPENPELYKVPTILSTISCYDTHTGHLNHLLDGVLLTALRTGASSAVASKLMANPDSETLGIIGCGAQSITQIHAISRLFNIQEVLYFDSDQASMDSLAERLNPITLDISLRQAKIEEILEMSDIISTATSIEPHKGPLFEKYNCKAHLHINAVGADFPGKFELPKFLLKNSKVCPDFLDQAVIEGECQQLSPEEIGPSWVELIKNEEMQREYQNNLTVFDSTGWALEDQVVATLFARYAEELGLGTKMNIESYSSDEKNPYGAIYQFSRVSES
ncbi:ornithine cyclodeaminase family protein [Algoriphagus sediminis]|uniref:Ornithine cyclodeaminase family protein n=1 Tax=Algoriphagus sediminis TaxID=3057113 RepID=A0ABT7YCZ8_9BACT|nr:ornithine cyclodeaminase family protein [Algoriphagus sediminis]MDN3204398.1 ornithine cyclodeaminase family protein [Algoriphagus sediminis]